MFCGDIFCLKKQFYFVIELLLVVDKVFKHLKKHMRCFIRKISKAGIAEIAGFNTRL